jgi:hypothetical protein
VWRGSGRRTSTDTRLVPQSANPHFRRLPLSGDALHHEIRWNVGFSVSISKQLIDVPRPIEKTVEYLIS